jgi:FtsX-like permease family
VTGIVPRPPAIVRRLLPHRLALAAAAVTVILAATLMAALAAFSTTVSSDAVRSSLASNPGTTISVTDSVTSTAGAAGAGRKITGSLGRALPGLPLTVWSAVSSDYLDLPPGRGLPGGQTHVISVADLSQHARLLAGSWPGSADSAGTLPAAAPAAVASALHLTPGLVLRLPDSITGRPVSVRITGIFRPLNPASPYWLLNSAATGVRQLGDFAVYPPLVTSPSVMAAGSVPITTAAWSVTPDVSGLDTGSLLVLAGRLQTADANLAQLPGLQNVTTGLPGLLSRLSTALVVARSQLAIGAAILLVIAGATLALATVMLGSARQAETALMRTRGASRRQLAGAGAAESVLLILPAVVAAPLLGGLLLPPLARYGPLAGSGLRLPAAFPAAAWLAALAVAAGCAALVALPWLRPGRSPTAERARSGRRTAVAAASRAGADLALLVLAALAGWQLAHYAAPVSTGLDGSIGIDPILVSAPVLALAAGALLLLRLLPLVVRLGDAAAARRRDILAAVAAWQISRRPLRQAGPLLLAVLAVATSVLAAAQWSSWQRSAQDQASFTTGADVRVNLPPGTPLPLGQVASLTRARGVTASTPVIRYALVLPGGTSTLLALDPGRAGQVVTIRPDLAGGTPGSLLSRLAPREPALGEPALGAAVPGRPARLQITASLTAGRTLQPVLFVQLTDAFGISYLEPAGPLPASGAAGTFTVALAPRRGAAYPLRLTGFTLQYLMPAQAGANAVLSIDSVRSAATMNGSFGTPIAVTAAGGGLRSSTSTGGGSAGASPKVLRTAVRGTSVTVAFNPGADPRAQPGTPALQLAASLTIGAAGRSGPLPAVATSAFTAATGQRVGSTVPVSVDGTTLTVKVVSVVRAFPTIGGSGGGLVVDQVRLQQALAAAAAAPLPVTEWWLSTSSGPAPPGLPAGAVVTDRSAVARSLLANPLAAAPELAMLAIAAAALILAAAGFAVAAATAGERSRDLTLLAALGATRRQLTRLLCLEQALLSVPAVLAGLVLGTLLARLVVPAVTLTAAGGHPQPPVLVQIPVAWPVAAAVVVAAIPVILAALTAPIGPGRRAGLAARTRLEAET